MAIDVGGNNFYAGGLHQRVLKLCGGNETLAKNWWNTPNTAFNLSTPRDLMDEERWEEVRSYLLGKADYADAPHDFGPREQFYNDASLDSQHYYYDDDKKVEKYMQNLRTSIGPWRRRKKEDVIL